MELTPRRRRALSSILAIVLAAESVSAVAAAGLTAHARLTTAAAQPRESVVTPSIEDDVRVTAMTQADAVARTTSEGQQRVFDGGPARKAARTVWSVPSSSSTGSRPATAGAANAGDRVATKESSTKAKPNTKARSTPKPRAATTRSGRNHVWIPSLRINRSVSWFPCDRKRPPDNYVYRWGCAGSNNVYLLGHAYSVFKPLHDAFVRGRLQKGMKAYYADARGKLHTYRVRWWKVTAPTTAASWAWAALRRPSMTLQTCVGKNSAYRLMVRLVEVG